MDLLGGSDSDSNEKKDNAFKINRSYAKSYDKFRKREERQRLLDKYGDPDDSESEEEEIRSTQKLDKEWLRAFAVVRFNQPRLYSGEKLISEEVKPVPKKSEEKKFTLKDQERKFILEKGGVPSDEDEDEIRKRRAGPSYFEEQEEIKRSLKKAIGEFDENDDGDEDSLLVVKDKTDHEERQEENDYLAWLKGEKQELEDKEASKELAPLKAYWSNPNLAHKEKVLRDYILNNGYMDQEGKDEDSSDDEDGDDVDLSEDEEFLDRADKYEKTYNFRHEEPGGCEIKSYPRVIETSVRVREENRRAERRKKLAERKLKEKEERMEELKMLQKLQREEKEEKLLKLQELSENPDIRQYLETDFDPEEHDKLMKKQYGDNYYQDEGDEEKPVFEDEEEAFGEDTDDWWQQREQAQVEEMEEDEAGGDEEELYADDPGFIMDADYDPDAAVPKKSKKEKRKAKKNKKDDKPLYDPTTKTFDEYLDEYLKDKINRLPFTYREVVPNDFGLSTDEILAAPDKELNAWVSVKRMSQYRTHDSEMYDLKKYEKKAKNQYKKYQVIPSLDSKQRPKEVSDIKRPKMPKKKKKEKQDNIDSNVKKDTKCDAGESSQQTKKQQKKKRKEKHEETDVKDEMENSICDNGEMSESKKKKKKRDKLIGDEAGIGKTETENSNCDNDKSIEGKKKKKKKKQMEKEGGIVKNETESSIFKAGVSPKLKKKEGKIAKGDLLSSKPVQDEKIITAKKSKKRKLEGDFETPVSSPEKSKKKMKLEDKEPGEWVVQKKSKKLKKSGKDYYPNDVNKSVEHRNKKYRKNFSDLRVDVSDSTDAKPVGTDKREVNRNLRMVMSKSRLDSYGLKKGGKKKKQDKPQEQD